MGAMVFVVVFFGLVLFNLPSLNEVVHFDSKDAVGAKEGGWGCEVGHLVAI